LPGVGRHGLKYGSFLGPKIYVKIYPFENSYFIHFEKANDLTRFTIG